MSTFYWVNGTGMWTDATNHWSTSSGGSPNAANTPTSADDVVIDELSGFGSGGYIDLNWETNDCHDYTSISGHNYTLRNSDSDLSIYGSAIFEAGLTCDPVTYVRIYFLSTETGETITVNGANINDIWFSGAGGEWTLQDDLVCAGRFEVFDGTFDANDHNVTALWFCFYGIDGANSVVIMGSGIWEVPGNDTDTGKGTSWQVYEYNDGTVTFIPETSTIKFTDESVGTKTFYSFGKTYYNLLITGSGTGIYRIGSNTFNDFKVDTPPKELYFCEAYPTIADGTSTFKTFTVRGEPNKLITIDTWACN